MKFKNFFSAFFLACAIFNFSNITSAEENISSEEVTKTEVQEYSATGEYRIGDDDTRSSAKLKALNDAKRKIAEQIGVYVESYSEMNNFHLDKDFVRTVATAMIKIKSEETKFSENGTLCEVFIVATADTKIKNIDAVIKEYQEKTPQEQVIKALELAGIYEWNGHYYKVFNEGMNWYSANKSCKEVGGHLVSITSREEQAAVQSIILYSGKKQNFYWTGGYIIENGKWQWITREEFSYTNWAKGEPNNDLGNEFILSIYNSGEWNDCPADGINHIPDMDFFKLENAGFICEWENFNDIKTKN